MIKLGNWIIGDSITLQIGGGTSLLDRQLATIFYDVVNLEPAAGTRWIVDVPLPEELFDSAEFRELLRATMLMHLRSIHGENIQGLNVRHGVKLAITTETVTEADQPLNSPKFHVLRRFGSPYRVIVSRDPSRISALASTPIETIGEAGRVYIDGLAFLYSIE